MLIEWLVAELELAQVPTSESAQFDVIHTPAICDESVGKRVSAHENSKKTGVNGQFKVFGYST